MHEENKGIILKKIKGFYYILDKQKKIHQCKIKAGLFQQKKQEINIAAVGDVISFQKEMLLHLQKSLEKCGYRVELAHNVETALNKLASNSYNLVLTDMTKTKWYGNS